MYVPEHRIRGIEGKRINCEKKSFFLTPFCCKNINRRNVKKSLGENEFTLTIPQLI